jgi:hypothetical protein
VTRLSIKPSRSRFRVDEHWATLTEFLGRSGDCEDNVIAKFRSLRLLEDEQRRELFAVLIAYHGATADVPDNQVSAAPQRAAIKRERPIF